MNPEEEKNNIVEQGLQDLKKQCEYKDKKIGELQVEILRLQTENSALQQWRELQTENPDTHVEGRKVPVAPNHFFRDFYKQQAELWKEKAVKVEKELHEVNQLKNEYWREGLSNRVKNDKLKGINACLEKRIDELLQQVEPLDQELHYEKAEHSRTNQKAVMLEEELKRYVREVKDLRAENLELKEIQKMREDEYVDYQYKASVEPAKSEAYSAPLMSASSAMLQLIKEAITQIQNRLDKHQSRLTLLEGDVDKRLKILENYIGLLVTENTPFTGDGT